MSTNVELFVVGVYTGLGLGIGFVIALVLVDLTMLRYRKLRRALRHYRGWK